MTDLTILDLDDEIDEATYGKIVEAELRGNEAATAYLEDDLDRWIHGLQQIIQDVQAQFARRRADDATFQQECIAAGHDGKQAWFARSAQSDQWRGAANGFVKHAAARLREVKLMRHDQNNAASDRPNIIAMLQDALNRLGRIEAALAEAGSGVAR